MAIYLYPCSSAKLKGTYWKTVCKLCSKQHWYRVGYLKRRSHSPPPPPLLPLWPELLSPCPVLLFSLPTRKPWNRNPLKQYTALKKIGCIIPEACRWEHCLHDPDEPLCAVVYSLSCQLHWDWRDHHAIEPTTSRNKRKPTMSE